MKARDTIIVRFVVLVIVIVIGFWAAAFVSGNEVIRGFVATYGYVGLFPLAILSGFNLAIPVPLAAFFPVFMVAGLDFWTSIVIMAAGMTIADTVAFQLGRVGRQMMGKKPGRFVVSLERLREKHSWTPPVLMLLYASFAPLPNEVLAIPLGLMGCRGRSIIPMMFIGNIIFNSFFAFGIVSLHGVL
ncbi:hypothetical protein ACFLZO_00340 [Patescibacteria group bacterium]